MQYSVIMFVFFFFQHSLVKDNQAQESEAMEDDYADVEDDHE